MRYEIRGTRTNHARNPEQHIADAEDLQVAAALFAAVATAGPARFMNVMLIDTLDTEWPEGEREGGAIIAVANV